MFQRAKHVFVKILFQIESLQTSRAAHFSPLFFLLEELIERKIESYNYDYNRCCEVINFLYCNGATAICTCIFFLRRATVFFHHRAYENTKVRPLRILCQIFYVRKLFYHFSSCVTVMLE